MLCNIKAFVTLRSPGEFTRTRERDCANACPNWTTHSPVARHVWLLPQSRPSHPCPSNGSPSKLSASKRRWEYQSLHCFGWGVTLHGALHVLAVNEVDKPSNMMSNSDLLKRQTNSVGTAVPAVSALLGTMHSAKRPRLVAKSDLNNDLKKSCFASKAAMPTSNAEPMAKRFMPSSPNKQPLTVASRDTTAVTTL